MEVLLDRLEHALAAQLRAVHQLTAALHRAGSADEFYERALDTIIDVLDADRASLLLFDDDGVMRFQAWRALSAEFRAAVEDFCPWTPSDTDVPPMIVPDVEADATLTPLLPVVREEGIRSVAVVPLVSDHRLVGKFMVCFNRAHPFPATDVALAEVVAGHISIAIERQLAQDRLRESATQAQLAANRMGFLARQLQASLLPPQLPEVPGLDLGARYVAGSAGLDVGGDFYDVFPVSADRHLVVLGDVCGRGVEAANTALLIRHVVRSAAVGTRSPAGILAHVNDVLVRQAHENEEARFATALVAEVQVCGGAVRVTLAVAGHPHPLVRDRFGGTRSVGVPGTLLGVTEHAQFTDVVLLLGPDHALVCFTDGATESRDGALFFGEAGVAGSVAQMRGSAVEMAAALEASVLDFTGGTLTDDLAILVLQPAP